MGTRQYSYVFLGLSITSSWGNGHATTYRALVKELVARGHDVLFLERNLPFYESNRDLPNPPYGKTQLYGSLEELKGRFASDIRSADLVMIGSYVPGGAQIAEWVFKARRGPVAFYDIDTPITLRGLADDRVDYISRALLPRYDLYLSFTGGPALVELERVYGAKSAKPLYCSVDAEVYRPNVHGKSWELGYLGTYSEDRQPTVERLLFDVARAHPGRRFAVAGAQYPDSVSFPANVDYRIHLPPNEHPKFYSSQRFTLNVTREQMRRWGWSPSVRLFEAAACETPVISDRFPGIESFFEPGREILLVDTTEEVRQILEGLSEEERASIGKRARERVLAEHTAARRAALFETYTAELLGAKRASS